MLNKVKVTFVTYAEGKLVFVGIHDKKLFTLTGEIFEGFTSTMSAGFLLKEGFKVEELNVSYIKERHVMKHVIKAKSENLNDLIYSSDLDYVEILISSDSLLYASYKNKERDDEYVYEGYITDVNYNLRYTITINLNDFTTIDVFNLRAMDLLDLESAVLNIESINPNFL